MKHVIAYKGVCGTSLGLMQEAYASSFVPWINWRIGVEGTQQRPPMSFEMGRQWVRELDQKKGSSEVFAVLTQKGKRAHRFVGQMGVANISWPNGVGSTGSIVGEPSARGRGVGTEAKLLLLYHAFNVLGLRKLTSHVKSFNGPSLGHLLKCGYKIVGCHRKQDFHEGAFVDEYLLEVFRGDWEPIWAVYQETKTLPTLSQSARERIHRISGEKK